MATWYGDGFVSGFSIDGNTTNVPATAMPGLTQAIFHLASPGMVDVNGVTRLGYPQVPPPANPYNFRVTIDSIARINFSQAEVDDRTPAPPSGGPNSPAIANVSMFITDAANFPVGSGTPTPAGILALGDAKVQVFRSASTLLAGNHEYQIFGPVPQPNRKYWVLVMPTRSDPGSTPSITNDRPFGNPNTIGRGISVWSNRTPAAPVITSPAANSSHAIGDTFTLTFDTKDPDEAFGGLTGENIHEDRAGVQVQYSRRPTATEPTPPWIDLPIATKGGSVVAAGAGWWIDQAQTNTPFNAVNSGGFDFWAFASMPVHCGSSNLVAGNGILPSGDWLIRVRTFDYGHPYPRFYKPLGENPLNRNPDNYPSINTSPWSDPVRVLVAAQVPPPVPLSPTDNRAVVDGTPVTLSWRYRNTVAPPAGPLPQARRRVQIRKVGEPDWFLLTDSASASTSYPVVSGNSAEVTHQYLANGGFESSGVPDGWAPSNGSVATFVGSPPNVHSGSRALFTASGTGAIIVSTIITLQPQDLLFDLTGWTSLGPRTSKHTFVVVWLNSAGDPVVAATLVDRAAGSGYVQASLLNLVRPAGAVKVQIGVLPTLVAGQTDTTQDKFDDFSFVGRTTSNSYGYTFSPTNHYEWRVQTTDSSGLVSDWSTPARFWVVPVPASGAVLPDPNETIRGATLGLGRHRAFVYRRGGRVRVGELKGLTHVDWSRLRDDMSSAKVIVEDWDIDSGDLLKKLQCWAYELVIYRSNGYTTDRVWEGPITLLTYDEGEGRVIVQAKDVTAYLYRRIIKQIMNDSKTGGVVTSRAAQIIQNVMAVDDPNVLQHLQVLSDDNDAKEYRNLPAFSRTAFEEIDDMAANAGLDYTAVGRAILLWGTKHRIGTLPEFTNKDLGGSPIVSEYGMSFANFYSVGDGQGHHGDADRLTHLTPGDDGVDPIYGLVEMLSSSWASDSPEDAGTYTQEGLATVIKSFEGYAERSISDRYPPPVVVRVPDNTTLNPDTVISIQHLVPGVVVPLRSIGKLRSVVADQKLDSVRVVEEDGEESVKITLSPFSREDTDIDTGDEG